jgi:Flp pilus assembly protein TadB
VLVGMPIVLFGVIWLMDRSYVRPLWAQGAGNIMVLIGAISMTLGGLVCRKIVNFKY